MATMPQVGEEFAGYRLRAVIGRGGMSLVYQAENPRVGSLVAMKVLAAEIAADATFRARFLAESRMAASLEHPNVIPIYDMGPADDLLYITMRFVSGGDLRSVLKAHRRLPPAQALPLIDQTARALDCAHRQGLVHRDVKPANILVQRGAEGDPDHVYLADFGISKHALSRSGLTPTGQLLGSVDYIAPEQIQGQQVDERTDIYSLGCVLYETLTGRVPFVKDADAAVIWAHVEEPPLAPSRANPDLSPAFDEVVFRALAKDPDDRYSTCRELVEAAREAHGHPARDAGSVLGAPITPSVPSPRQHRGSSSSAGAGSGSRSPAGRADSRHPAPGSSAVGRAGSRHPAPASDPRQARRTPEDARERRTPDGPRDRGAPVVPPGRRTPDGARNRRPPDDRGDRRTWLPAAVAAIAVALIATAAWFALGRGDSGAAGANAGAGAGTTPAPTSKSTAGPSENVILTGLSRANDTSEARGLVPPRSCKAVRATSVTCTDPSTFVSTATFTTYPSLRRLYAAYEDTARRLSGRPFTANRGDCDRRQSSGEVSWNHDYEHPRGYSVAQMIDNRLSPSTEAAGRLFCTLDDAGFHIVWVQNDGRLLGSLDGSPHTDAFLWWRSVHHSISLTGSDMGMTMN